MSEDFNFGGVSTRSVKKFCEAARKDKAFLETAVKEMRADIAGFVKKRFKLTPEQIENLEMKFDHPETTELFALTCIRALKLNQNINIRFVNAEPPKRPNFKVSWKKCKPFPDPGQPEFEDCCGLCVEWECRKGATPPPSPTT
jgi:hypothetical protein